MNPTTPGLSEVLRRLDTLERQNRWLKRLAVVMLACAGTSLLMAADAKKDATSEMEKFALRDVDGKVRAVLLADKTGPVLRFLDDRGRNAAGIGLAREGLTLYLNDAGGKVQTGLCLHRNGIALSSYGSGGRLQAGPNAIQELAAPVEP